jgi:hypothetical protein
MTRCKKCCRSSDIHVHPPPPHTHTHTFKLTQEIFPVILARSFVYIVEMHIHSCLQYVKSIHLYERHVHYYHSTCLASLSQCSECCPERAELDYRVLKILRAETKYVKVGTRLSRDSNRVIV